MRNLKHYDYNDFHLKPLYKVDVYITRLPYQNKRIDIQIYSYDMIVKFKKRDGSPYITFPYTAQLYSMSIQTYKQGKRANVFYNGIKCNCHNPYGYYDYSSREIIDKISQPIKFNDLNITKTFFVHETLKRFLNILPFIIQEKLNFKYTMRKPWSKLINEILS